MAYEDEEYDSYPEAIPFPEGRSGLSSRSVSATSVSGLLTPSRPSNTNDDVASIRSSEYLMDMIPENITLKDGATITSAKRKEFVLPATDERSPYFVSVPIPVIAQSAVAEKGDKGLEKSSRSKTVIGDTEGYDGQFVREYPTDMLIDRFYKWKKILKSLIAYLREVAYAQEQFARINNQLRNSVKFPFLTDLSDGSNKIVDPLGQAPKKKEQLTLAQKRKMKEQEEAGELIPAETPNPSEEFRPVQATDNTSASSGFLRFGSGSIQDIQVILKKYHVSLANQQFKVSKEIVSTVIPKLEDIKKDLSFKIKEIKDLNGDFKTNINYHLKTTGNLLKKYVAACKFVDRANYLDDVMDKLKPKHDPYLLKLQLDIQIKRQIAEENYLQEAFVNLQSSGLQLEKIIYGRIQHVLQRYSTLIDSEARLMIKNLCQELQYGILAKPPALEWDNFVSHHPLCLLNWQSTDPVPEPRRPSTVIYPNMKSPMSKCIRAGYFMIKSESETTRSSSYHKGYFILTSTYIHQFRSSDFFRAKKASTGQNSVQFQFQPNVNQSYNKPEKNPPSAHNGVIVESSPNSRHNEIIPIVSIPLSQCALIECTDRKFVIEGKAEFSDKLVQKSPKKSAYKTAPQSTAFQNPINAAIHTGTKYTQEPTKLLHKSKISKLVKGAKAKALPESKYHSKTPVEKEAVKPATKVYATENVKWTFKMVSQDPTEDEVKYFKKWAVDIKNLTKFPNPRERFEFIEDRLMKSYSRHASVADEGRSAFPVTVGRVERPNYISLGNSNFRSNQVSESNSALNTPAIDEQGNLVTFSQKPSISSPHYSYNSDQSNKSNTKPHTSLPGSTNLSPLPMLSPASVASDGSGGYFAIPLSKNRSHPNSSTKLNEYPNHPSSNMNSGSSTPNISSTGYFAPVQCTGVVPKVKVSNEDIGGDPNSGTASSPPFNTLRKNISTGSIPTLSNENPKTDSLYRQNNSSTNLLSTGTATARVSAVRKHKKNVSFSSLNSLMFSKKGGQYNGQVINGISENADNEDEVDGNTGKIKLNQSIYS